MGRAWRRARYLWIKPEQKSPQIAGWDELRQMQAAGDLPDGSLATTSVLDDTQRSSPATPQAAGRNHNAPFAR